jgi:hypothetical protein
MKEGEVASIEQKREKRKAWNCHTLGDVFSKA